MRKFRFLYLGLLCFLAVVVIFVFDGYLGVYDSATIKTGEFTQEILAGSWPDKFPYSASGQADQKMFFTYQIDNRWFTTYRTTVNASLWQENSKVKDLYSQTLGIRPFKKVTTEWPLDPAGLNLGEFQQQQFTVRIEQDGTVREIITSFYLPAGTGPAKPILPPPGITR